MTEKIKTEEMDIKQENKIKGTNENKLNLQKLIPTTIKNMEVYEETLDYIFRENDLVNIAISGAYGSGKSSVLFTYKQTAIDKKFIHISLAHFGEIKSKDKPDESVLDYDESILEWKIINQLLHQIPSPNKNIPQTRFTTKSNTTKRTITSIATPIIIWLISIFYYLLAGPLNKLVDGQHLFDLQNNPRVGAFLLVISFLALIWSIIRLIQFQCNKRVVKRISIKGIELSHEENIDSYFDKYLDDVLYLFDNCGADAIVFEDIDRYDRNIIFSKLKEINFLVNEKRKANKPKTFKPLKFIYMLRDDIFKSKDRTKFFDFIIPIIPVIDTSNSYGFLHKYLGNTEFSKAFEPSFLRGLSLYIDDMRVLKNIVNEFTIYYLRMQNIGPKNDIEATQLFSLIVYKNLFPNDFSLLQLNDGFLYDLFSRKSDLVASKNAKLKNELEELKAKRESLSMVTTKSLDDLAAIYFKVNNREFHVKDEGVDRKIEDYPSNAAFIHAMRENPENISFIDIRRNTQANYTIKEFDNELKQNSEYLQEKKKIIQINEGQLSVIEKRITDIENAIMLIQDESLFELIDETVLDELFEIADENDKYKDIKNDKYIDLIRFLISNGYIDETYDYYMSYFYGNALTSNERTYLINIKGNKSTKNFSLKLDNINLILPYLQDSDYRKTAALNNDLVTYLLQHKYEDKMEIIFRKLETDYNYEFALQFREKTALSKFLSSLNHSTTIFVKVVLDKNITFVAKKQFIVDSLCFIEKEDLLLANKNNNITNYINANFELFDKSNLAFGIKLLKKMIKALEILDVKIEQLDYNDVYHPLFERLYRADLFEINMSNILTILIVRYELLDLRIERKPDSDRIEFNPEIADPYHKNFTMLMDKPDEPIVKYILENINSYMDLIFENCEDEIEDSEDVAIQLLNNEDITIDKRKKYISYLLTSINNIVDIYNKELWSRLFEYNVVAYTVDNIIQYYISQYKEDQVNFLNDTLVSFINYIQKQLLFHFPELKEEYGDEVIIEFFQKVIVNNDLSDESYKMILSNYKEREPVFTYEGIDNSKIAILIELGIVYMSKENLLFFREHYQENIAQFINEYHRIYTSLIAKQKSVACEHKEVLMILEKNKARYDEKIQLIDCTTESIAIADKNYQDVIRLYILKNKFDENDLSYLIKRYDIEKSAIKEQILIICGQHYSKIINEKLVLLPSLLKRIICDKILDKVQSKELLANQIRYLKDKQLLVDIFKCMGEDRFVELLTTRNHPLILADGYNEQILKVLRSKSWSGSYHKYDSSQYRAYGKTSKDKS